MTTQRALTSLIIGFWLLMTSLLVRLEVNPDKSDLLTVPPSHVFKLMFTHAQASELDIIENTTPVGNLTLLPKVDPETNLRMLSFNGNFSMRLPDSNKRQRVSWDGTLAMDRMFNTKNLQLAISLRDSPWHISLNLDPDGRQADYEVKHGDQVVKKSSLVLNETGVIAFLRNELGVDPSFMQNLPGKLPAAPTLAAKQTELKIRKEKVVAFLLTVKQGDLTLADIYVSQLGQILNAKTILGYSFTAEDMMPPP